MALSAESRSGHDNRADGARQSIIADIDTWLARGDRATVFRDTDAVTFERGDRHAIYAAEIHLQRSPDGHWRVRQ